MLIIKYQRTEEDAGEWTMSDLENNKENRGAQPPSGRQKSLGWAAFSRTEDMDVFQAAEVQNAEVLTYKHRTEHCAGWCACAFVSESLAVLAGLAGFAGFTPSLLL